MKLRNLLKPALVAGIFYCASFPATAQHTYMRVSTGYNFSIAKQTDNTEISYGKGITPAITIGRMFTNRVGAELSIGYLFGGKDKYAYTFQGASGFGNIYMNAELTRYSRMLLLQPAFVVSGNNTATNIYAKFGPIIGVGKMYEKYYEDGDGSPLESNLELKGGAALGGQTTFGVNFNAKAKTSFFAEANLRLLWYSPTNGEVVKLLVNGKDRTADMSMRDREVEYVKNPSNGYSNYDTPTQAPKHNHPLSSAGISIGIKYNF